MSIATYDFHTLYKYSIQWTKKCDERVDHFLKWGGEKKFIAVTTFSATWNDNINKFKVTFDKTSLKLAIDFPLENCFLILVTCSFNGSLVFPCVLA